MKSRFDGLDVTAMVSHLQGSFLDRRVVNVYDGGDSETYIVKFDKAAADESAHDAASRGFVLIESGKRFHPLHHFQSEASTMPSPFAAKLRKHLRGLRLSRVSQIGTDRVVVFSFASNHLILELYDKGNLILCDKEYTILALLRSHVYRKTNETDEAQNGATKSDSAAVQVGHAYPVAYATTISEESNLNGILDDDAYMDWIREQLLNSIKQKKKKKHDLTLKTLLLSSTSGVSHYGPALLEHCILHAKLDPHKTLDENAIKDFPWQSLRNSLVKEGQRILDDFQKTAAKGYIRYTIGPGSDDKLFQEFLPYLFQQHTSSLVLSYDSFGDAVYDFYQQLATQKAQQRQNQLERSAQEKLEKVRQDQEARLAALRNEQGVLQRQAEVVQQNAQSVDAALTVINSALNSGMDWEQLGQLLQVEQEAGNPVASLIHELKLKDDAMVMKLPQLDTEAEPLLVSISLSESAHANASMLFAKYRAAKEKSAKTIDSLTSALKAAEENAKRQLNSAQKRLKASTAVASAAIGQRKPAWFEKFHWFITSDNYLVLGGKDAHQNELLVKRYLRPGDAYLHADVFGSTSTILRAKRRRGKDGKTKPVPLSDQALREAGNFTICRSSAWTSRMITSAYWVESHQVSKTAPSGEYLTVGSFMIRGKKNFLPPSALEMGIAVLFRLGDEESITRHKNERRDFALMSMLEGEETESDAEVDQHDELSSDHPPPSVGASDGAQQNIRTPAEGLVGNTSNENTSDSPGGQAHLDRSQQNGSEGKRNGTEQERKGLSARDRKLLKKYGSLGEAKQAQVPKQTSQHRRDPSPSDSTCMKPTANGQANLKRGKKSKMKRIKNKYMDQDEEDRELAMLALQGGEKDKRGAGRFNQPTEPQRQVASETAALLYKDVTVSAAKLPDSVRAVLADCVTVKSRDVSESEIRWDKFDADTLEQLAGMDSIEAQLAAARRLEFLMSQQSIDNVSASLAGILRVIRKYGHEGLIRESGSGEGDNTKRNPKVNDAADAKERKPLVAGEGLTEIDADDDTVDDTNELNKLTGKPHPDDVLQSAIPVCAPYQSLTQYLYRVKLTPGSMKRGKAAKQCMEMLLRADNKASSLNERCMALIKHVNENDWVNAICPDVKITAPGASKVTKRQKSKKKP